MANMSITECIARLRKVPERAAERAVDIMREEIEETTNGTGELAKSVKAEKYADGTYRVGTHKYTKGPYGIREVGAIIQAGRPELYPRYKKALRWEDPYGGVVFAKYAGPVPYKNNFVERTKNQLEKEFASGMFKM